MTTEERGKRRQSIYIPEAMRVEMKAEARRLRRSLSSTIQRAWKLARAQVRAIPSTTSPD